MKPSEKLMYPSEFISRIKKLMCGGLLISCTSVIAEDLMTRSSVIKNSDVGKLTGLNCNSVSAAPSKIVIPIGKSSLVHMSGQVSNRSLGNPNVAQAMLVSPETLYVVGMSIGSTNMIIQEKNGGCRVMDVEVTMDPETLIQTFKELFPEEKNIRITAAAESLVLSGMVSDALVVAQAVDLATAYVRRPAVSGTPQQDSQTNPPAVVGIQPSIARQRHHRDYLPCRVHRF